MLTTYPVFFAANKNYMVPLAVTIRSLIDHVSPDNTYALYIATNLSDLDEEHIQRLKSMETANVSITLVDSSLMDDRLDPHSRACFNHISLDTFARFYIDRLIPAYTYVLYLDVDLLIKDDIAKLFTEAIAAAGEKDFLIASVPVDLNYFNAGVILFHVETMVREGTFNRLLDYAVEKKVDDELTLNSVVPRSLTVYLDNRWNCAPSDLSRLIWDPNTSDALWSRHKNPEFAMKLTAAFQNPGIIHYLGAQKPWNYQIKASFPYQVVESFYKDWWDCYQKTPYFDPARYQVYQTSLDATLAEVADRRVQLKSKNSFRHTLKKLSTFNFKKLWKIFLRKARQ